MLYLLKYSVHPDSNQFEFQQVDGHSLLLWQPEEGCIFQIWAFFASSRTPPTLALDDIHTLVFWKDHQTAALQK